MGRVLPDIFGCGRRRAPTPRIEEKEIHRAGRSQGVYQGIRMAGDNVRVDTAVIGTITAEHHEPAGIEGAGDVRGAAGYVVIGGRKPCDLRQRDARVASVDHRVRVVIWPRTSAPPLLGELCVGFLGQRYPQPVRRIAELIVVLVVDKVAA